MQKEFLYEATIVDNPFDLIERDIAMYGEEYLKSMNDSEFPLNYGMTRKEYLFDFRSEIADYSSNKLEGIRRNTPFTEQSLSNLIEGYKSETIKHLSAVRITSGQSPAKKPSEAQLNNRTSVKPSELKQKIAQKAQQQINQAQEAVSDTVEDIKGNVGDEVGTAIARRNTLANNLGTSPGIDYNAHHIIPVEVLEKNPFLKKALEVGFDFNGESNGAWIKRYSSTDRFNDAGELFASPSGTHASHPNYTNKINELISKIDPNQSPEDIAKALTSLTERVKVLIQANPGKRIDLLFSGL